MDNLLSTKAYAEKIGTSLRTVQRLLNENRIPGAKKIGRDWLIPADVWPIPSDKGPKADWEKRMTTDS